MLFIFLVMLEKPKLILYPTLHDHVNNIWKIPRSWLFSSRHQISPGDCTAGDVHCQKKFPPIFTIFFSQCLKTDKLCWCKVTPLNYHFHIRKTSLLYLWLVWTTISHRYMNTLKKKKLGKSDFEFRSHSAFFEFLTIFCTNYIIPQ